MGKLFGTDGIRGVANQYPMTPDLALNLGKTIAYLFKKDHIKPKVIVGKDTRLSSDMIEYAIISGICSNGCNVLHYDILPTPAVAYLTRSCHAIAGVMVSASHNPFYDNGIKIFGNDGFKLSDDMEREIESILLDPESKALHPQTHHIGIADFNKDSEDQYCDFLFESLPPQFTAKGMKVVVDCSNGATFRIAPRVLNMLGMHVDPLFIFPDGKNINDGCGSQHPEKTVERVKASGADLGLAFDGDGDRLIAVDEKGNVVTGDQIIAVCAGYFKRQGRLKNNRVVTTVMSNIGLKLALKKMDIEYVIAQVGDRYVLQEMIRSGAILGGEDSGHMIFLDQHTTGDGIFTALKLIEILYTESRPLSELTGILEIFPQVLMNIPVGKAVPIESVPEIMDVIRSVESDLGEKGRVLVRYSGTQPLCRVMVEGPTDHETRTFCNRISDVVRKKLGALS
jgi:phosphoglucosamine mutase